MRTIAKLSRAAAAALALSLLAQAAAAQGWTPLLSPRPLQRVTEEYKLLLLAGAFDRLEQAVQEARAKNLTTSDGQPLLSAIYSGIAGCSCDNWSPDGLWPGRKLLLDQWHKQKPDSTTVQLALAAFPVKYAWRARGNGYSNTVTADGWKVFKERMEEGRRALDSLDPKAKESPVWYETMLEVGLAQGWRPEKYDALFQEAVAKYPFYIPLYFWRVQFYGPKWYGSDQGVRKVADEAVIRTRVLWGEMLYARLNWLESDDRMFLSGRTDWARMRTGFEQMIKKYPDPWNVNNFARFACQASDFKTMATLLPAIGERPITMAWNDDIEFYNRCRAAAGSAR